MGLLKDIDKTFYILFLLLFINFSIVAENRNLTFKYEDSINNEWFLITLNSNYHLDLINKNGEKTTYLLDDPHILKELELLFNKIMLLKQKKYIPLINSDVTETIILKENENSVCFLFNDDFITINNNQYNEDVVKLIKKLLAFVKRKDDTKLNSFPSWLYE